MEDSRLYNWTYKNFYEDLLKGVNRSKDKVFERLGYSISFFSSLNNNDSVRYSLSVGKKDERFINTFVVKFPISFNIFEYDMSNLVSNLFNETVNVFEPFWASIVNSTIHNKTSYLNEKNKPQDIHWLNFWSKEIEENINLSRIDELKKKYLRVAMINFYKKILYSC